MKKHDIDIPQFKKTKREPATLSDIEDAFKQIVSNPSKPKKKSENREPTKQELEKRWKLKR